MNILILIIAIGILIYLLLKFGMYIYRPFYLSKLIKKAEEMYNIALSYTKREIESSIELFKKWESGDRVARIGCTEKSLRERVESSRLAKNHEEEVYEKFLRLKERFIHKTNGCGNPDYTKFAETIIIYQRYLEARLKQIQNGSVLANAVTLGAISFDELEASRNEILIILEENERKLDKLLAE